MRFNLDGLEVFFPYDYIYREQYDYMYELKRALDDKGHVLLEMPTGTGKTVCLISLITSYQFQYKQTGKLIYCTRTVPEMTKCMEEIKKVIAYRVACLGEAEGGKVLALCLSSRRNMCIHEKVMEEGDRDTVDTACRNMTASWVRNRVLQHRQTSGHAGSNGGSQRAHVRIEIDNRENQNNNANDNSNNANNNTTNNTNNATEDATPHELCDYYENYFHEGSHAEIPQGIYSLDDLRELGQARKWCPYFMTRHLIHHASILVYNYQYMLDPKVANIVSKELESESIVVFDEAHNIDNVCIEALSVTLNRRMIDAAQRSVTQLSGHVSRMKAQNDDRLRREAQELVRGLVNNRNINNNNMNNNNNSSSNANNNSNDNSNDNSNNNSNSSNSSSNDAQARLTAAADAWLSNPVLSRDLLEEAVPGNIRKAEHFLSFLRQIVQYLKRLFHQQPNATSDAHRIGEDALLPESNEDVYEKTPIAFLHQLQSETGVDRKSLKFTFLRLNMLLRTLEMTSLEDFAALSAVCNFTTLVATYLEGFAVIYEKIGHTQHSFLLSEPLLQLVCLDASIAIAPVFERFRSVIITSGTLSPIDLYPKLLNFHPIVKRSLPMSTFRQCLLPLIISRGSDQTPLSTRYETRLQENVVRNYGQLLLSVCSSVPDGVCGFFTSYQYMEYILQQWNDMGILTQILQHKLIFLETKDVVETTFALDNYRRANDCGRGALFLSVARGKIAEGIDFDKHYGRCVVLFGIPYQYTLSHTLKSRLRYLRDRYQIRDHDFLTFDALRQSAQCVGRVLRSKTDYGIVVLADQRYGRQDKKAKLPLWIQQFLLEKYVHISTDMALDFMKGFLKEMGQDIELSALRTILLSLGEVKRLQSEYQVMNTNINNNTANNNANNLTIKQESISTSTAAAVKSAVTMTEEELWEQQYAEEEEILSSITNNNRNNNMNMNKNANNNTVTNSTNAKLSTINAKTKKQDAGSDSDSSDDSDDSSARDKPATKRRRFTLHSSATKIETHTANATNTVLNTTTTNNENNSNNNRSNKNANNKMDVDEPPTDSNPWLSLVQYYRNKNNNNNNTNTNTTNDENSGNNMNNGLAPLLRQVLSASTNSMNNNNVDNKMAMRKQFAKLLPPDVRHSNLYAFHKLQQQKKKATI